MKRCNYCGHDNVDDAAACCGCGTSFLSGEADKEIPRPDAIPLNRGTKQAFIFGAIGIALLALIPMGLLPFMNPLVLVLIPAGLWAAFRETEPKLWNLIAGWAFYATILTILAKAKTRAVFITVYAVLLLALALNVVGCYKIADTIGRAMH